MSNTLDCDDITVDMAFELLSSLRVDSATGPDGLPARILRGVARELAAPAAMIASTILACGR